MDESSAARAAADDTTSEVRPEDIGHPRGTLAIVIVYGILFALGWWLLYLFEFLPR
jgi:hypothetical protein